MAVKDKDKIPSKSTFEANDSLLAFTPNGARRISQSVMLGNTKKTFGLMQTNNTAAQAGEWIKILKLPVGVLPGGAIVGLIPNFNSYPFPALFLVSNLGGANVSDTITLLSPGSFNGRKSFSGARIVLGSNQSYFEVKAAGSIGRVYVSMLPFTDNVELVTSDGLDKNTDWTVTAQIDF